MSKAQYVTLDSMLSWKYDGPLVLDMDRDEDGKPLLDEEGHFVNVRVLKAPKIVPDLRPITVMVGNEVMRLGYTKDAMTYRVIGRGE